MTKNIGHLFVKILRNLFFSFVFLTSPTGHHEVALNEFAHLLLEFEKIPVGVATDTIFFGVDIGDFLDLPGDFVDVHERDYNTP